jgi:very-short-patch-repair endonuclease
MKRAEVQTQYNRGNLAFVKEVAKYFMDFLETDFHKHKNPKRSVKLRNKDNLLIGINLRKYPSFAEEILKLIGQSFKEKSKKIERGIYRSNLPKNLLEVIRIRVGKISPDSVAKILDEITTEVENASALYKSEHDKAITTSYEASALIIKTGIVLPFIDSIEKPIESLGLGDEEELYLIEEELTEILFSLVENKIGETVNRLIGGEVIKIREALGDVFLIDEIKKAVQSYFDALQVGDLFHEFYEIAKNKDILDKQDFYLYLGEISYGKSKYPLFYLPFSLDRGGETLTLTFDQQLYVNKKAVEFIAQEYNNQKNTHGNIASFSERIIYLAHHQADLPQYINKLLADVCNFFQLDKTIDVSNPKPQSAKSLLVRVTNSSYIALCDKSDEALVNDYEEILQQLNSESGDLAAIFNELVEDFIHKNPISFNPEVEEEWDCADIASKLVFASPVPLNGEQLQILSAIRKPDCKYIIVEGPPGTGKSHTITAISFDAILRHQSVLILSDKKEALDVVEDKITETMNKVRYGDQEFQNPILRLGKIDGTYNQILARSTLEKIKTHQRAVKKGFPELEDRIEKLQNSLKEDIAAEVILNGDVDITLINDYCDLDNYFETASYPFDLQEISSSIDGVNVLRSLRNIVSLVLRLEEDYPVAHDIGFEVSAVPTLVALEKRIEELKALTNSMTAIRTRLGNKVDAAMEFMRLTDDALAKLNDYAEKYEGIRKPIIGFLFSGKKLKEIDTEFSASFPLYPHPVAHTRLTAICDSIEVFDHLVSLKTNGNPLISFAEEYLTGCLACLSSERPITEFVAKLVSLQEQITVLKPKLSSYRKTLTALQLDPESISSWKTSRLVSLSEGDFEKACDLGAKHKLLERSFASIPQLNYAKQKREIETLVTTKVTHLLDTRVVDFYTNNQNDASTLRDVIKAKRRFPKEQFAKLKDAFPCILAGIRDYAEYIPLESGLFDLVIIDEASQVSIAQAFPALIRAKKVLILGDRKQFSNVKSAQARSETNFEYKNRLEAVFRREVSTEDSKLIKLAKFDIKTSILEFFESISNYQTQLLKHFRGYRELIGYSNTTFYADSLQVMKIRAKPISEVIKFTFVVPNLAELIQNTNRKEIEEIIAELRRIKDSKEKPSVGIITPHTNQQKLLMEEISKLPEHDFYFDELKLKIMTFDTCQGEERDVIIYSMVATEYADKLWGVFIKSLASVDTEEDGKIKVQRLNVGFSRSKELVHFFVSKPLDKFSGSIGEALRHFHFLLEEAKKEKGVSDVDGRSKMEPEVLNWFYQTRFWNRHKETVVFQPQFEIGKYLRQLDSTYLHPEYKVDFLLVHRDHTLHDHKIIIEYDGFREHFKEREGINAFNYEQYYSEDDVFRQKVLESYGYRFLRVNKFNIGKNPIQTLDLRIASLITNAEDENKFLDDVHETIEGLENGNKKECPRCKEIRDLEHFRDSTLVTGIGRFCRSCKAEPTVKSAVTKPIKTTISDKSVLCPRCSSPMVLRSGRYGKFYGCSIYPRCRGIRNVRT